MSEEKTPPSPYSHPTSGGGLLLRSILFVGIILAVLVGIVWYVTR